MKPSIAPWWCRGWQGWWANQKTSLRVEDASGQFHYDVMRHEVRWCGRLRTEDGQRPALRIHWGPGTPFMPPRLYLAGVYSSKHQLRDRSLCLADAGLAEVFEIDAWLERARHWLHRYQREGWAIEPSFWPLVALQRPDPGHRLHERPRAYLGLPESWSPVGPCGEFMAQLPLDGGGLGTLLRWRSLGETTWLQWDEGEVFAQAGAATLDGFWFRSLDQPTLHAMNTWCVRASRSGRPSLVGYEVAASQRVSWDFLLFDEKPKRRASNTRHKKPRTIANWLDAMAASCTQWHEQGLVGLPLSTAAVSVRTRASRSGHMDSQVRAACVVIVGLGALGSEVAHILAKEQVGRWVLLDGDLLLPGNLARHRLDLAAVGGNKAEKMREHILRHHPGAQVDVHPEMLDEVLPRLQLPAEALLLGLTGDVASERIVADMAAHRGLRCVHAWTECHGRLLRLIRTLPGQDVGLHELRELPPVPWPDSPATAAHCGELIQPGSSINLHAAANRTARLVLSMLGDSSPSALPSENHVFFTAEGLGSEPPNIPPELRAPYGQLCARLERPS